MSRSKIKTAIRSLFASYLLAAVLLIVLAFLLYKFHLKESHVGLAVSAIYVVTCFLGGFLMGKGIRQRRFFWGFLLGALYWEKGFPWTPDSLSGLSSCAPPAEPSAGW